MPALKAKEYCLTWLTLHILPAEKYLLLYQLQLVFQLRWLSLKKKKYQISSYAIFPWHRQFSYSFLVIKCWDRWLSTRRGRLIPDASDFPPLSWAIFQHHFELGDFLPWAGQFSVTCRVRQFYKWALQAFWGMPKKKGTAPEDPPGCFHTKSMKT